MIDAVFRFFIFPTAKHQRQRLRWCQAISRSSDDKHIGNELWTPNNASYVCSKHFVDRQPTMANPYPTKDLGYKLSESRRIQLNRPLSPEPVSKVCKDQDMDYLGEEIENDEVRSEIGCQTYSLGELHEVKEKDDIIKRQNYEIRGLKAKVTALQKQNNQLKRRINACNAKTLLTSDDRCNFYTGIAKLSVFYTLLNIISPYVKVQSRKTLLKNVDRFLLVLMRLRLGLTIKDLAYRFGVAPSGIGKICKEWLPVMARELGVLIFWPSKEKIQASMPLRYKHLPNLRAIIDCTECFIQSPSSMTNSCATYSHYKHHNTVKILIAIAPNGFISFISKAYCGRASDKAITDDSGFYDLLHPNDMIMADKGFHITEELEARQVTFLIPPGRRGAAQMSINKVRKTKEIANLRIYVEQIIGRLKIFQILSRELPNSMCPQIDNIVKICCAITNLKSPMY